MGSRTFYRNIIIRVIILVASIFAISNINFSSDYFYSIATLFIITLFQTWSLINYILKQRKDMSRMLSYIRDSNPTLFFSKNHETPFSELGDFLNEIGEIVRDVRIDKEAHLQYLNHITGNIPVGLIAFDQYGTVEFFNPAAKEITGLNNLNTIGGLDRIMNGLANLIMETGPGERKLISLKRDNRVLRISVKSSHFRIGDTEKRMVSMQDIGSELDEKEIESWQKLIRILNHEIINSVTPITSLSSAIAGIFRDDGGIIGKENITDKKIKKAITGLGYIEERGRGLIDFVSRYRSLTSIPEPVMEEVNITALLENIVTLKSREATKEGISIKIQEDTSPLYIYCDRTLTEHVIINLLNNAIESFESETGVLLKKIEIRAGISDENSPVISIRDTGKGIDPLLSGDIFIPFFTTKENGSGIGLSLSRQIMRMQGGTITMAPSSGGGTIFYIKFR